MRTLAPATALLAVVSLALPGCVVAIDTSASHDEAEQEQRDKDAAYRDTRLLQLEERMDRLEQHLSK